MPLSQAEIKEVEISFNILDVDKKGFLNKQQVNSLFNDLKINLSDEQSTVIIDGMFNGKTKADLPFCVNVVSMLHDEDELGFLKICFRGLDKLATRQLTLEQAVRLSEIVGNPKTSSDFSKYVTDQHYTALSFSNTADIILGIKIPENADPFNGMGENSTCCLLI